MLSIHRYFVQYIIHNNYIMYNVLYSLNRLFKHRDLIQIYREITTPYLFHKQVYMYTRRYLYTLFKYYRNLQIIPLISMYLYQDLYTSISISILCIILQILHSIDNTTTTTQARPYEEDSRGRPPNLLSDGWAPPSPPYNQIYNN